MRRVRIEKSLGERARSAADVDFFCQALGKCIFRIKE